MTFYSPLRYPGGKARLANEVEGLILSNKLLDCDYVELFAGGSAVGLHLLFREIVRNIHINDIDYHVYAFWYSVVNHCDEICYKILKADLSVESWQHQRSVFDNPHDYSIVDVGFSTFYLNRTNRSGILKAGVIGGKSQQGIWKMNARFNKADLIQRVKKIERYKDRIMIYNKDAITLMHDMIQTANTRYFFYIDPPYYQRGKDLYIDYYSHEDHINISKVLSCYKNQNWLLSYDNNQVIKDLYRSFRQVEHTLSYHAGRHKIGTELLVVSDSIILN